jgi:hypothetical protein
VQGLFFFFNEAMKVKCLFFSMIYRGCAYDFSPPGAET